jgi:hypothetical protein
VSFILKLRRLKGLRGGGESARNSWRKREELTRNQCLTPVIKDNLVNRANTRNKMMCIDAKTGNEFWSKHVSSNYDASPLYLYSNMWFFSVRGEALAIKAGRVYEVIA